MLDVCFINGNPYSKNEIATITWLDYIQLAQRQMPKKLYKYFPNVLNINSNRNYSQEALQNNTVYLNTPLSFDDPYDSSLCLEEHELYIRRLQHYAELCGFQYDKTWDYYKLVYEFSIFLYPYASDQDSWETAFHLTDKDDNSLDLTHRVFATKLFLTLQKEAAAEDVWQKAFANALHGEYEEVTKNLAGKFRIACFATTPNSMLMWSHYANSHKGFCVEYDIPELNLQSSDLLNNLFPVIYSDERTSVLEQCLADLSSQDVAMDTVWSIYKYGLLTKSLPWGYQNEWRLISLDDTLADQPDYNCSFFPISKVYLGAKMEKKDREKIIQICDSKGIPSTCVMPAMTTYTMQECAEKMVNPQCVYKMMTQEL